MASKIAENMDESLEMPTATSVRVLPMKMLIEDRDIINRHLLQRGEPKASFTHFIAWAIIQALEEFPNMNNSFLWKDGVPTAWCRTRLTWDWPSTCRTRTARATCWCPTSRAWIRWISRSSSTPTPNW
ncbi:MAG: 2-oxo acid dehydrogenase subunit E2 [Balneolaceae bacterium]|nr:2-oxo acid dehydrogenase subunit E2 [Balneolaceae bacterium]